MCYHETLTFLTCTHKIKTTSLCPSYLRHEHKTLGPPSTRRSPAYLPYAKCRNLLNERFIVAALCPECNTEEFKIYASVEGGSYDKRALERSQWIDYEMGRDAYYTGEGKDGMGDKRWKRKGVRNGVLRKRRFEGVTWSFDNGGYDGGGGGGREDMGERERGYGESGEREEYHSVEREDREQRYEGRGGREEERHGMDERYYGGESQYYDNNDRYEGHGRDGRR